MRKQDVRHLGYFIYNGVIYTTGTVIRIKPINNKYAEYETAIFVKVILGRQDTLFKEDIYQLQLVSGNGRGIYKKEFYNILLGIQDTTKSLPYTTAMNNANRAFRKPTLAEEFCISGLDIAWIWYIFLMLIATVFNENVVGWIVLSIIFFTYRNKKLREAGYRK